MPSYNVKINKLKHLKIKVDKFEINWTEILKDIEFTLNEKDRISIVGGNWVWKTTLLKILTWQIKEYEWDIHNIWNLKIGYLAQVYSDNENKTVREELKDAFTEINKMEEELKNYEEKMSLEPENMELINEYSSALERFNNIEGYSYNNKIHQVAYWMGVWELLEKKLTEISWGQRTKVALCKILLESPDILMLDEPTNFIDLTSVEWLEKYLEQKWHWGYVIISHDRAFLDKTCNKTYELWPQRNLNFYHTNYSGYLVERQKNEDKLMAKWEDEQEYIKKQEEFINRFRAWSRASQAKSRERALEKMDKTEKPYIPAKPSFIFDLWEEPSDRIYYFKEVFIWRADPLFFINELHLNKGQRVWIVWENGAWKSTLLKTLLWKLEVLDGTLLKWKWLKVSYYSQMHEELDKNLTVRENFEKHWLHYPDQQMIGLLKYYLFDKEDIDKKAGSLSWGQMSKLLFAILGQKETNLLVLDEPTNHLDYDSREALEKALQNFKWTILFISHDRYFVNKIATHTWIIKEWELVLCYWNYEDYRYKEENGLDFDASLFDESAQMDLVLEEKLWENEAKRIKNKFSRKKR